MANVVKFKINGLSSALNNVYTRVTDLSRNELYSGETLVSDVSGNVELDIGTAGSNGQGVIVYGDNYSTGNEQTFKSFTGYGLIEGAEILSYDNVIFFGASIMQSSFKDSSRMSIYTPQYAAAMGDTTTSFYEKTENGAVGSRYREMADELIVERAALTGRTLVVIHGIGNDVANIRPYATASQSNLDNTRDSVYYVINSLESAGWDVAFMGASWRNYSDVPPESNGSQPFNENIYWPQIQERCPFWWDSELSRPWIPVYSVFKDAAGLPLGDSTHPYNGVYTNGFFTRAVLSRIQNKPRYDYTGKDIVINIGENDGLITNGGGIPKAIAEPKIGCGFILDSQGDVTDATLAMTGGLANNTGRGNAGNSSYSLLNDNVLKTSCYTQDSVVKLGRVALGVMGAGKTGTISFTASRNSTTGTRYTQVTVGGVTKDINCEAVTPEIVTFPFTADADGIVHFSWNMKSGSLYAYLGGIRLQFD